MRTRTHLVMLLIVVALASGVSFAQQGDRLGEVEFPNSCSPAVQEKLLRGIATLHSFYYSATQKAFNEVAAEEPSCAIAAWGYASILLTLGRRLSVRNADSPKLALFPHNPLAVML